MNKRIITIMLLAFMVVKNPVFNLGEVQKAYAEPQVPQEAVAVSEAHITENINSLYQKQNITTEEKALSQIDLYKKAVLEERAKKKAELEARMKIENAGRVKKLAAAGLKTQYINNYVEAERRYGVPWQVLAAVHFVESGQSGDRIVTSYAGAQGPMQFMPSTWYSYAQDGDGDGRSLINDVDDAIYTGANYMAANGAAVGNVVNALFRYNHDSFYVNHVLSIARAIGYNK